MKKNDWIYITIVAIYSFLFYQEVPGINFTIFNLLLVIAIVLWDATVLSSKAWVTAAIGTLITGVAVVLYSNVLTVITGFIATSTLSFTRVSPKTSMFFGWGHVLFSYASSGVYITIDAVNRIQKGAKGKQKSTFIQIMLFFVFIVLVVILFSLYRQSNALYSELTKNINLDFISSTWFLFTAFGALILYGFFYHRKRSVFNKWDAKEPDNVLPDRTYPIIDELLSVKQEGMSGIVLFSLLNLLILSVNVVDINFLYMGSQLPEEMSYSEIVHQGIGSIILSILIAISIIIFYFRSRLNFANGNGIVKALAYIWIIQNAFIVFSTAYRNGLYIEQYSLTYKRIGVFVYLGLSLIGLTITFLKIYNVKTSWFMVRRFGWSLFVLLVLSSVVPWTGIVIEYNIDQAQRQNKELDKSYLLSLGKTAYPYLQDLQSANYDETDFTEYNADIELHQKMAQFTKSWEEHSWKSWNYTGQLVYNKIKHNIQITQNIKR